MEKDAYKHMQTYRSGHNGAHSKCVCPPGHEGSNPSVCVKEETRETLIYQRLPVFYYAQIVVNFV